MLLVESRKGKGLVCCAYRTRHPGHSTPRAKSKLRVRDPVVIPGTEGLRLRAGSYAPGSRTRTLALARRVSIRDDDRQGFGACAPLPAVLDVAHGHTASPRFYHASSAHLLRTSDRERRFPLRLTATRTGVLRQTVCGSPEYPI